MRATPPQYQYAVVHSVLGYSTHQDQGERATVLNPLEVVKLFGPGKGVRAFAVAYVPNIIPIYITLYRICRAKTQSKAFQVRAE